MDEVMKAIIKEFEDKRNDGGKYVEGYMKGQNDLVKSIRKDAEDIYDSNEQFKTILLLFTIGIVGVLILVFGILPLI